MTSTPTSRQAVPIQKIADLDAVLALVNAPPERFLLMNFCAVIQQMNNNANILIEPILDYESLAPLIEKNIHLPKDSTARIFGTHGLKGLLDKWPLYAAFTTNNPEKEPVCFSVIRAMLLNIQACPDTQISDSTIKILASLLRNYSEKGANVELALQNAPALADPRDLALTWNSYFRSQKNIPKTWVSAIATLLESFKTAYRYFLLHKPIDLNKPKSLIVGGGKRIRNTAFYTTLGHLNGDAVWIGSDFLVGGEEGVDKLVDELALPVDDLVDTTPIVRTPIVPVDEEPIRIALEKSRTLISAQFSYQNFLQHSNHVLLPGEFEVVTSELRRHLKKAISQKSVVHVEQLLLLYLTASTGWTLDTLINLNLLDDQDELQVRDDSMIEGLSISQGLLLFRVPDVEKFWRPKSDTFPFPTTSERVQLKLPITVAAGLKIMRALQTQQRLRISGLFSQSFDQLHLGQLEWRQRLRLNRSLPRFSINRLRHYLAVRLYAHTHDNALVILVSGQSHCLSTAPLHYYQAHRLTLQATYQSALIPLFPPKSNPRRCGRFYPVPELVGSRLQFPDAEIQNFVRALIKPLSKRPKTLNDQIASFNAFNRYLAFFILAGTGHRNGNALARLRFSDFETQAGFALLSDKVLDPGHRARLVTLPVMLCRQIDLYQRICLGLSERLASSLSEPVPVKSKAKLPVLSRHLLQMAQGDAPMLIQINAAYEVIAINNDILYTQLPTHWNCKLNFFRHRLATRLREMGVFSEYVQHQMGHMETGHQPFGRKSTLSPLDFRKGIQPKLDQWLTSDGWQLVRLSLPEAELKSQVNQLSFEYQKHQEALLLEERQYWRSQMRRRSERKLSAASELNVAIDEVLMAELPTFINSYSPPKNITVSDEQLHAMLARLLDGASDSAEQLEWRSELLRHRLQRYRHELAWQTPLPPRLFRPLVEPSPFLPGNLAAYRDVLFLRTWVLQSYPDYGRWKSAVGQNAGMTQSAYLLMRLLLLFITDAGFLQKDRMFALIKSLLGTIRGSCKLPGVLIVPVIIKTGADSERSTTEILSGVCAAAAVAWLNSPEPELPSDKQLDAWVHQVLPEPLKPKTSLSCLDKLLSTAAMARRFEVPGVLYAIEVGAIKSVALNPDLMLDTLDGRLQATQNRQASDSEATCHRSLEVLDGKSTIDPGQVRKQYRSLTALLHARKSTQKWFPISNVKVHPGQFTTQLLAATRRELALWARNEGRPQILQALSAWLTHLLSDQGKKSARGPLRIRSAHTYITRFGKELCDLIRSRALHDLTEEEMIQNYQLVIASKSKESASDTLMALMRFHQFLVNQFGIPDIETDELYSMVDQMMPLAEAVVITDEHYQFACKTFDGWTDGNGRQYADHSPDLWLIRAAKIALIIQYRFGLRSSEVQRLRLIDLQLESSTPFIRVATTNYGRTKSVAGNRVIPAHSRLVEAERIEINEWLNTVSELWSGDPPRQAIVFSHRDQLNMPLDWSNVVVLINTALRYVNAVARPHSCRHSFYSAELMALLLGEHNYQLLQRAQRLTETGNVSQLTLRTSWNNSHFPSYRMGTELSSAIGHANVITSVSHYFHLAPVIAGDVADSSWSALNLKQQAALANLSYQNWRQQHARTSCAVNDARFAINALQNELDNERDPTRDLGMPNLPDLNALVHKPDLIQFAQMILAMRQGISCKALMKVNNISVLEINQILCELVSIQARTGFVIIGHDELKNAFVTLDLPLPPSLSLYSFKLSSESGHKKKLFELLDKLNKVIKKNQEKWLSVKESILDGYRQQQSSVYFKDIEAANHFLIFIDAAQLGAARVVVEFNLGPGISNIDDGYSKDLINRLACKNEDITININRQKKLPSFPLLIKISIIKSSNDALDYGIVFWQTIILSSLYLRCCSN
jgi:integrase